MEIEKDLFERGGHYVGSAQQRPFPAYIEVLLENSEGALSDDELAEKESVMRSSDIRSEAMRHLYRGEQHQQYALNIRGGGERYRYYLSTGHDQNNSVLMGNGSGRLNLNLQNTFRPAKGLEISAGIWYAQLRSTDNGMDIGSLRAAAGQPISTYLRLADSDGNAPARRGYVRSGRLAPRAARKPKGCSRC